MAEYYLISQLPSLDGIDENMPLPISEEQFLKLCSGFLNKKLQNELSALTLLPPEEPQSSTSPLVEDWNNHERNLRLALAVARAEKLKKSFGTESHSFPAEISSTVATAVEIESPLEAEVFLNNFRLEFLESLRPMDTFSNDFLFYYGLKLKLLSRIRQFDAEAGKAAYKNIYSSILNGDRLEAIQ